MLVGLGARLRQLRGNRTQEEFAKFLSIAKATYNGYEREARCPDAEAIARICARTGADPEWLLFGGRAWREGAETLLYKADALTGNGVSFMGNHYLHLHPSLPSVKLHEAKEAGEDAPFLFNKDWLQTVSKFSTGFSPKAQRFVLMYVSGDRMDPTLKNDDLVLVDTVVREVYADKIYAVYLKETIVFCYIDALPDGWRLRFEDSAFAPVEVANFETKLDMGWDTPAVMGMVVWSSRILG